MPGFRSLLAVIGAGFEPAGIVMGAGAMPAIEELPAEALNRLRQLEGQGGAAPLFTSDLSVNEFLLIQDAGFEPLGLVVGSSIYHVGIQVVRWTASCELNVLSRAMYHACELAMNRMEAEAEELGADGIVGVRLTIQFYDWGKNMAEFMAIGTAVRHGKGGSWRTPAGRPFTSDLTGQDFWTLLQTGQRPVALVMGNCVYHEPRLGPSRHRVLRHRHGGHEVPLRWPQPSAPDGPDPRRLTDRGAWHLSR